MEIPEHFEELSIRMSEVLNDSGVGKVTVMERRETYLWRERMETILLHLLSFNNECFHFGSQSEGTTTPGLLSDIDLLISQNSVNIMTAWRDWEAGMLNLLMLHDDSTPPQQYLLQAIMTETPIPEISMCNDVFVMKHSGELLLSADRLKQKIEHDFKHILEATINGPSVSFRPNWDMVCAFIVLKPLPEIQNWIDRCRGRHWPPAQLLEAARVAPCFLVQAGHSDSDYKREEWRLSPNLIERMLMFSFNMTQLKCYVLLKLIKKSLFNTIVGDCITSFHCKTIMFFTLERTYPCLWFEHNLLIILLLCLRILRNFLRLGRLPHYIIKGVNLFDGKVSKAQQRRLLVYVDYMIKNNLQSVFYIGIDNIGSKLQTHRMRRIVQAGELRRECLHNSISFLLRIDCMQRLLDQLSLRIYQINQYNTTFEQGITYALHRIAKYSMNVRLKSVVLEVIKHVYALSNSMQSSNCLRQRNVAHPENIMRFKYSLNTDVASSRLKLASILYCGGHLHAAVRVLEDVQSRYHNRVKAVCGYINVNGDRDLQVFANMQSGNGDNGFSEMPFAFCVKFLRKESCCTPFILLFEMKRRVWGLSLRHSTEKVWMDSAEIDARPFLHYLEYLTYGGLGERDKQLCALGGLESYMIDSYHLETALNLLGHCYEMEGHLEGALLLYEGSLLLSSTNNAANWHVRRVMRLISG